MSAWASIRRGVVTLAVIGLMFPTSAFADPPTATRQTPTLAAAPIEVALSEGNRLTASLRSANGQPLVDTEVTLVYDGVAIASPRTDQNGVFSVASLRGGAYTAKVDKWRTLLRAWLPGTAPPHAITNPVLTVGGVQRGQTGPAADLLSNPWTIAGLATLAITIPVVLNNTRDNKPAASN